MEAQLFAQSASIDNLLNMMRSIDPASEDLAQNEDLLVNITTREILREEMLILLCCIGFVPAEHGFEAEGCQATGQVQQEAE